MEGGGIDSFSGVFPLYMIASPFYQFYFTLFALYVFDKSIFYQSFHYYIQFIDFQTI